jgi:hypothetical protein
MPGILATLESKNAGRVRMSATLSPRFLADLAQVYANLRPQTQSSAFLSDLAHRLDKWRSVTEQRVRARREELPEEDPLRCPISLFRTMDYGRLETAHTRTLAWLLDPEREHGFKNTVLAALLRRLSGHDCSDGLRVEQVRSEYPIDGSGAEGRLDVLAEGVWEDGGQSRWVLVIEAKVDAWEGEDQLQKYEAWLRSHAADRQVFRVFLTPEGRLPQSGAEEWEPLSYLELVQTFRSVYGALRHAPGFHFLRFYLAGVLQDVCHCPCVGEDGADPYAVAAYLKTVHESRSEGAGHEAAR